MREIFPERCRYFHFYPQTNAVFSPLFADWLPESVGVSYPLKVNMHLGLEVVCFALTGCLLRKMSAFHPERPRVETTLKTQHGNSVFLQEKQAARQQQDTQTVSDCVNVVFLPGRRRGFTVGRRAASSAERALFWPRLNLRSEE